jgi:hypothetical protein
MTLIGKGGRGYGNLKNAAFGLRAFKAKAKEAEQVLEDPVGEKAKGQRLMANG